MQQQSDEWRTVDASSSSVATLSQRFQQGSKVIRAPSLKRGKSEVQEKVCLERVLGLTVSSNAALACDPNTGTIAYPAGCTVVLLNPRKNRQSHVQNSCRKSLTSLCFSPDGRYLVTGECGHLPSVRVWDAREKTQVAEFSGHKFGINCVAFAPNHKYVVSVGSQHDMIVNVWDWKTNMKVASNKVSSKVKAISFAENGSYFVTVGNRHVKFWYLEYSRSAKYKEPVPLMGRSAILGEQRNNYFCDVGCGRGEMGDSTYAITKSGLLCEFNNRRLLDKWVELRTTSANCMVVGEEFIFIGCAQGIVRCFSPFTLQFVTTLPRTHYLGVDVSKGLSISHMASHPSNAKYPDTVAVAFDEQNHKVTCVYNDHSMYVWDVSDVKRVGKSHSFLYHTACIWGVETSPSTSDGGALPPGSFITCSSDDTIRIWNLDPNINGEAPYKRNIYSNDLLKIVYIDPDLTYLKEGDSTQANGTDADSSYDGCNGVRCLRVSPDGLHLASGDRAGNIRIHDLRKTEEICKIEAHDAEVLCLEYARKDCPYPLLASASRDRLIHVFSVDKEYDFLQTLDDHSSSITAVRFINAHNQLQMVSCGADKSIIFRQQQFTNQNEVQFARGHNVVVKTTLYDMEVDVSQKHILTACQDRNIRVYNASTGKHSKTFKGSLADDGSLIKVVLDSSGIYAATSCTDKTLAIYDYYSGECLASVLGHSELVTGLRFTPDGKHLLSVSGDGCIFLWRLPQHMTITIQERLSQQAARAAKESRRNAFNVPKVPVQAFNLDNVKYGSTSDQNSNSTTAHRNEPADYQFNVGSLPLWAKKQMTSDTSPPHSLGKQYDYPKGRWAQRVDTSGITLKSFYDSDSVIPIPQNVTDKKGGESDTSKDSSMEYREPTRQTSNKQSNELYATRRTRHLTDESSVSGSFRLEDMAHDGDIEDCFEEQEDGNSTEPELSERLMYYPQADDAGSDFTVNAMDVEELRRSQRRHKKPHSERPTDVPLLAVTGSQESDDDDDDTSTPSADAADKNLLSMLSVSNESLDHVGRRERYLKSNFESLSGPEGEAERERGSADISGNSVEDSRICGKKSISSQFRVRNVDLISAVQQTQQEARTSHKREELKRQVLEMRRKLDSIGYRSPLKSSQSISDLSHSMHFQAKDLPSMPNRAFECESELGGGMRRACSLSDLSQCSPKRLMNAPIQVSGKKISSGPSWSAIPRPASKNSGQIPRSVSVGILNQSDSESEAGIALQKATSSSTLSRLNSSLLKPTISSQNKAAVKPAVPARRRSLANSVSSGDINKAGNEDTSSEEAFPSSDQVKSNNSAGLSKTARDVTQRLTQPSGSRPIKPSAEAAFVRRYYQFKKSVGPPPPVPPRKREENPKDVESAIITPQFCASIAESLCISATRAARLRDRLTNTDRSVSSADRDEMIHTLESAIGQATNLLSPASTPSNPPTNLVGGNPSPDLFSDLIPTDQLGDNNSAMVHVMQQFSERLLSVMQQKMAVAPPDNRSS